MYVRSGNRRVFLPRIVQRMGSDVVVNNDHLGTAVTARADFGTFDPRFPYLPFLSTVKNTSGSRPSFQGAVEPASRW